MDPNGDLAAWPPDEEGPDGEPPEGQTPDPDPETETSGRARLLLLMLSLVAVVAWNAWQLRVELPDASERDRDGSARAAVFVAAQAVDAHTRREGEPPEDLAEVGLDGTGLRYERSGDAYTIRAAERPDLRAGSARDAAGLLESLAADSSAAPTHEEGG